FQDNDCVADLIENGRWKWPSEWWDKFPMLKSIDVPSLTGKHDQAKIWDAIKGRILLDNTTYEWEDIIGKVQAMHCKNNIKSILSKIGLAACVYTIWRERNLRTFQNEKRNEVDVTKVIIEEIKWKLANLTVKKTNSVTKIYEGWEISPIYNK
ncbi:hypothetical protein Tco_1558849, partial [Tanacetum coccineum]